MALKTTPDETVFINLPHHGLGNKLWVWGKGLCFARDHQLLDNIVCNGWTHININRYILNYFDKRSYHNLFNSSATSSRNQVLRAKYQLFLNTFLQSSNTVHEFSSLGSFTPLIENHMFLARELSMIAHPSVFNNLRPIPESVAIHVRLGDFQKTDPSTTKFKKTSRNARTPIVWFAEAIDRMKSKYPEIKQYVLFTDGKPDEVRDILKLDNVILDDSANPLSSLMRMSTAMFLIASRSTFSLFANYFGQMPSLFFPGSLRFNDSIIFRKGEKAFLEKEWAAGTPLPDFPDRFWEENHSCFFTERDKS